MTEAEKISSVAKAIVAAYGAPVFQYREVQMRYEQVARKSRRYQWFEYPAGLVPRAVFVKNYKRPFSRWSWDHDDHSVYLLEMTNKENFPYHHRDVLMHAHMVKLGLMKPGDIWTNSIR